jgi:hypothetical protein
MLPKNNIEAKIAKYDSDLWETIKSKLIALEPVKK